MSPELITILTGAAPISELRGAIPLATLAFDFSPGKAYILSVIGNLAPILPLFFFLRFGCDFLMKRSRLLNRFFVSLFSFTRRRHESRFGEQTGEQLRFWVQFLALFVFVAVPLPLTGAWSGTIAAFVFNIPLRRALPAITGGVLLAGAVVLGISLGFITLF